METLFDILQVSSWREVPLVVLDIAIAYYIVYRVLLLIKGTRAAQMLLGLMLVIIIFFISSQTYLNLRITNWFLDKFIANFIIIIVIIFQSDIRRALAQAGSTSWLSTTRAYQESFVLEEIITASVMLSKRSLGALVAIEREADLSHYAQDAILIDADISKDLLFSIFLPEHQNPLHDGAVIIQKGRIAAAGCKFPLTNNPRVEKSLGTRHRAGIGLSEEYDVVVVICSEETGLISIAYKGELYRGLEATEMRELLQSLFLTRSDAEADTRDSLKAVLQRLRPVRQALKGKDPQDKEGT